MASRNPLGAVARGNGRLLYAVTAIAAIVEGVANLVLSLVLARYYGIYGVAIGTLIPSVAVQMIFWPRYISTLVGLSAFEVVWQVWTPVFLSAIPFAIVSYTIERSHPAHSLMVFVLQVAATLPVFFITVALIFRTYIRNEVMPLEQEVLRRERSHQPGLDRSELRDLQLKAKKFGFWGLSTPEEYGGMNLPAVMQSLIWTELGRPAHEDVGLTVTSDRQWIWLAGQGLDWHQDLMAV